MQGSLEDVKALAKIEAERKGHKIYWRRVQGRGFHFRAYCKNCRETADVYSRAFDDVPTIPPSDSDFRIVRKDIALGWTNVDYNYANGRLIFLYCEKNKLGYL